MRPAFAASADFAIDKPVGQPCPNLRPDSGCGIHDGLRELGFPGCAVFDCFGAGQHVVQVTFGGRSWRVSLQVAEQMFAAFRTMRQLKELLWYLAEALKLLPDGPLRKEVERAQEQTETLAMSRPDSLGQLDAAAYRHQAGWLLYRISQAVRNEVGDRAPDREGADLMGANLRGADLRGANLRGAYLLDADLRGADLRKTDLVGVDLRGADLRRARLDSSIFLTQPQLDAATGDAATIPPALQRPRHWPASGTSTDTTKRPRRRRSR